MIATMIIVATCICSWCSVEVDISFSKIFRRSGIRARKEMDRFRPLKLVEEIHQRLCNDGIKFLTKWLQENDACIAGSYVESVRASNDIDLAAHFVTWRANDVDIWASKELDISKTIEEFSKQGYSVSKITNMRVDKAVILGAVDLVGKTDAYINDVRMAREAIKSEGLGPFPEQHDPADDDDDDDDEYVHVPRFRRHVRKVLTFTSKDGRLPIQIIAVNSPTVFDAVLMFDLDVCRIIYDGKNVLSAQSTGDAAGTRTVAITQECLDVISKVEWTRTIKRMGKYIDRGYTPVFTLTIEHITRFIEHLNTTNIMKMWNAAVLRKVWVREWKRYVLVQTHLGLPYWTRSGAVGADLVHSGEVLCHISDIRVTMIRLSPLNDTTIQNVQSVFSKMLSLHSFMSTKSTYQTSSRSSEHQNMTMPGFNMRWQNSNAA
jgi:hypothetical protein